MDTASPQPPSKASCTALDVGILLRSRCVTSHTPLGQVHGSNALRHPGSLSLRYRDQACAPHPWPRSDLLQAAPQFVPAARLQSEHTEKGMDGAYDRLYDSCMTSQTDFRTLAFFAADHAETVNGKVYVNGGFWSILRFPAYPAVVPSMALVAVLEVPFRAYHQDHLFEIGMEDSDGNKLPFNVSGEFRVGAGPEMRYGDPTSMPLSVPITGLQIKSPGDYVFSLHIDGTEIERFSIRSIQVAVPMKLELSTPEIPPEDDAP